MKLRYIRNRCHRLADCDLAGPPSVMRCGDSKEKAAERQPNGKTVQGGHREAPASLSGHRMISIKASSGRALWSTSVQIASWVVDMVSSVHMLVEVVFLEPVQIARNA